MNKLLLVLVLLIPSMASATLENFVNPKNGNFSISYTDIELTKNQHNLSLERTYNSKSSELGWFGYGWGSSFETYLVVMPDGSAAIQENGSGQINYYMPQGNPDIQGGVTRIVEVAMQRDKLTTEAASELRKQLLGDENLRMRKVRLYGLNVELPQDSILTSSDCRAARVVRIADGYKRTTCAERDDYFDLQGRFVSALERDGYGVSVNYDGNRPATIKDTLGQSISLKWTGGGLLASAYTTDNDDAHMDYTYSDNNNLTMSNKLQGNSFKYQYDAHHNMTRIGYIDNTSMTMEYDPSLIGVTRSITDTDGDRITYDYRTDPKDTQHYWTTITFNPVSGSPVSRELEFKLETTETGSEQIARFSTSDENSKQETVYDSKGRIARKTDNTGRMVEYTYDSKWGKIATIASNEGKTTFSYDGQGNLNHAENNKGQIVEIDYQSTNRIQRMVVINKAEETRNELTFKYNSNGRPIKISLIGVGDINVEYDDTGEIGNVQSDGGAQMGIKVTLIFQETLKILQGSELKF